MQENTYGFYEKYLERINNIPEADMSEAELFTPGVSHGVHADDLRRYTVYKQGDNYYITDLVKVYPAYLRRYDKIDNEINQHKEEWSFEFTPDGKHIYRLDVFKNDSYPERSVESVETTKLPANDDYIKPRDSCEYKGIKLTFNSADSVTIEKNGEKKTLKAVEDDKHVYSFRKRTVRAKCGAYGLFSFMESIAEQAKIERRPFWHCAYMVMDRYFEEV